MHARAWYSHYDDDVRPSLQPYPDRTLIDYLDVLARDHPRRASILFKGATLTFADIDQLSTACGAALVEQGVSPGDRVALVLPNCPQFIIAQFGAWKAGAIVAPLNPTYSERELEGRFTSTRPRLIVVLTPFYERVVRAAAQSAEQLGTPRARVIATSIKEYLPPLTRLLFTVFRERRDGHRITLKSGDDWLSELLARHRSSERPGVSIVPDDRAVILSSGGTTGTPKGVVGLHRHYVTAGTQVDEWTRSARAPFTDVVMLPLPLFHVYANVGVQPLAFLTPSPLSLTPNPRDVDDVLTTIRRVRPTCFSGVPALYVAMLNHPDVRAGKVNLRSLKICVSGSAPLLADTKQRFEAQTGARLVEGYALTESMMAACLNPIRGVTKLGSVGLPLPDVDVRIVDAESGTEELPVGDVGELIMHAPQCMLEYWENQAETTTALRVLDDGHTWLYTGDLAYIDPGGYVFLVDRKKDMVKTSGFQVWPREIEEVLASHPGVREVGVAGTPDPTRGEVTHAWVVLETGHEATEHELRAYCRERLAPYKVPARVHFRTELPKTQVGKVLRRVLAAELTA